jgi:hypothetical protein
MTVSSNKRKKDLLTEEDISHSFRQRRRKWLFPEESDDFWFDTSEVDSDSETDTSSVLHESVEKCQIFHNLLYLTVWRVQSLHFLV